MRYMHVRREERVRLRKRWRHPADRGGSSGIPRDLLLELLKLSTWKKHPAPFAKTQRGKDRRAERRFVHQFKYGI